MTCLSLGFLEQLLIWLVIIGAVFALIRLVLPLALGWLGAAGSVIERAINIVLWAAIAIIAIIVVFGLLSCLIGSGGGLRLPGR